MAKKYVYTIEDCLYLFGTIALAVLIPILVSKELWPNFWNHLKLPPCPFHLITGYYCPGCGGTRAFYALLHGRILQAFFYHPAVPYGAAIFTWFMATQTLERLSKGALRIGMRYRNSYVWAGTAILLGNFIARNLAKLFFAS